MGDNTGIEWTDATWNPVTGCSKVSAGCKHCYAERDWARLSANRQTRYFGRAFTDVRCHADVLALPLRWRRPRRIFVTSMSDLFHPDVPDEFIDAVFAVMALAPHHTFQVLTKRPERMRDYLRCGGGSCIRIGIRQAIEAMGYPDLGAVGKALPNIWLGVSIDDQATAEERIPLLLDTPAAVRWISAEPLLGPVRLDQIMRASQYDDWTYCDNALDGFRATKCGGTYGPHLDWVVVGGESGPKARPMHPAWVRSLRDQCQAAGVPFLFKQWGEWLPALQDGNPEHAPMEINASDWPLRVGKKSAGRQLDGVKHDGYPAIALESNPKFHMRLTS
ncbi:MAG: DUF5131 family protein [Rhodocyclaceae bacterium]|nr:DUF5131 family protein [Rhodocyclaceae bacterium]